MVSGGGWTVGVGRLALRGDVLVRAYRRAAPAQRRLVFACQFHTCAVADHTLSFTKQQLDHAAHGKYSPLDKYGQKFTQSLCHFFLSVTPYVTRVETDGEYYRQLQRVR